MATEAAGVTFAGAPCLSASFSNAVNHGVEWSCTFNKASAPLEETNEDATYTMRVTSKLGLDWTSMPLSLVADSRDEGLDGSVVTLSGQDRQTVLLSSTGKYSNTLHDKMASEIIATLNGLGSISCTWAATDWKVREFDIQGETLGGYYATLARAAGAGIVVLPNGALKIISNDSNEAGAGQIKAVSIGKTKNKTRRIHKIYLKKVSRLTGEFTILLDRYGFFQQDIEGGLVASTINVNDQSQNGFLYYLAGWDAVGAGGGMSYTYGGPPYSVPWAPQVAGGQTVLSITGSFSPPNAAQQGTVANGKIVITGVVPGQQGYDPKFEVSRGAGGAWHREKVIEGTIWDTAATAGAVIGNVYLEENKGVIETRVTAVFDPNIAVACSYAIKTLPAARYDSVNWSVGEGAPTLNMTGWVAV